MIFRDHNTRFILALLTLSTAISSCGKKQTAENTTETTEAETKRDDLPDMDFGGAEFNILCRTEWSYEFDAEQDGDVVNDAVYARNRAVEERFGVKFNYHAVDGGWALQDTFLNALTSSVLSGDQAYDMVAGFQAYIVTPATGGRKSVMKSPRSTDSSI